MRKLNLTVMIIIVLFAFSILIKSYAFELSVKFQSVEKCSLEIEGLKLCVNPSAFTLNSGEPVNLKLFWVNSSDSERSIIRRSTGYSVNIKNEKGEKLIPELQKKIQDNAMSSEDLTQWLKLNGGSNRGIQIGANETETDELRLNEYYNYDLTNKGIYYVSISKKVPSLENGEAVEFVIKDIKIEVR